MNWLIIEDALKDRYGHWLEFIQTFKEGLAELGDNLEIIGPRNCDASLVSELAVEPILPDSLWGKSKGSSRIGKAASMLVWLTASFVAVSRRLARLPAEVIVFVPTVGIPHLILWWALLFSRRVPAQAKLLLYFMATPVRISALGKPEPWGVWGKVFFRILGSLAGISRSERLVLATETEALSRALSELSGARFVTLPQPVRPIASGKKSISGTVLVGSYGPARHEKGSDLMIVAIEKFLGKTDCPDIIFAVQWTEDFDSGDGTRATISERLRADRRFVCIDHLFASGEYADWLERTSLMLLPYRNDYALRGSRVVLEAVTHGIPVLVSRGTTLEEHMSAFGAGLSCDVSSPDDIVTALETAIARIDEFAKAAAARQSGAREHFSVARLRQVLLGSFDARDS
jgi:glycosyltransferase involved in cell wall biosynthesis